MDYKSRFNSHKVELYINLEEKMRLLPKKKNKKIKVTAKEKLKKSNFRIII